MPDANFTGSPRSGTSPLTVTFDNTSTGTAPLTYAWDFGDGGTSTAVEPSHTYNPGTYTVKLTATNAAGSNVMTRTDYIVVDAPPGSRFFPLTPTRVLDSRSNVGANGVFRANTPRNFVVADGTPVPADAVAVTGNLTVTGQSKAGYVVLAPAAGATTSSLNFPKGDTRANGVTVALGPGGRLNATYVATAGATTHLIFDVTGYYTTSGSGSRFHAADPDPGPRQPQQRRARRGVPCQYGPHVHRRGRHADPDRRRRGHRQPDGHRPVQGRLRRAGPGAPGRRPRRSTSRRATRAPTG